jgi:hypothetical protein
MILRSHSTQTTEAHTTLRNDSDPTPVPLLVAAVISLSAAAALQSDYQEKFERSLLSLSPVHRKVRRHQTHRSTFSHALRSCWRKKELGHCRVACEMKQRLASRPSFDRSPSTPTSSRGWLGASRRAFQHSMMQSETSCCSWIRGSWTLCLTTKMSPWPCFSTLRRRDSRGR